jgi:hypothetical protein
MENVIINGEQAKIYYGRPQYLSRYYPSSSIENKGGGNENLAHNDRKPHRYWNWVHPEYKSWTL